MTQQAKRHAGLTDQYIGKRIRARRLDLNLSQEDLGQALKVSFQQIQKYEKGTNRVSTATLIDIANILEVAPLHFYQGAPGMPKTLRNGAPSEVDEFMATRDGLLVARSFVRIADPKVRRAVANAIGSLSRAMSPDLMPAE